MSLSKEERLKNIVDALTLMLEEVGENPFEHVFVNTNDLRYEAIHSTTWKELEDRSMIATIARISCVLTAYGWRTAMMVNHRHEDAAFKEKLGTLSSFLKDAVKGRDHPAILGVHDLGERTGLGWPFVVNALKADMIEHVFRVKGATITRDNVIVTVPIDYGLRPL